MNSRIDRQVENVPVEWITDLQNDINELKTGNQTFGPESLIIKRTVTGSTWDINGDSVAANAVKQYRVLFTATTTKNAYAELTYSDTISGADGFEKLYLWPDTTNTSATTRAWSFTISTDVNPVNLYVQFSIKCLDTGTITVTAL